MNRDAAFVLAKVAEAGLDAPILIEDDIRWGRLGFGLPPGVDLRDRFRGALVGGAIGDAMGRANEGTRDVPPSSAGLRHFQLRQLTGCGGRETARPIEWVPLAERARTLLAIHGLGC